METGNIFIAQVRAYLNTVEARIQKVSVIPRPRETLQAHRGRHLQPTTASESVSGSGTLPARGRCGCDPRRRRRRRRHYLLVLYFHSEERQPRRAATAQVRAETVSSPTTTHSERVEKWAFGPAWCVHRTAARQNLFIQSAFQRFLTGQ